MSHDQKSSIASPSPESEGLASQFREGVAQRTCKVAVVGMGYVGLPLALGFVGKGFNVTGFDIDQGKVDALLAGNSYIKHISAHAISKAVKGGGLAATTEFNLISDCDAVLICVPTPLTRYQDPDLSFVESTCEAIAPYVRKGQLIVLESTTYPGTTREVMVPILERGCGLKAGSDFFVAYSPEREDPGNPNFETVTIPKIVSGMGELALAMTKDLYAALVPEVVPVESVDIAEAAKLTENIFRSVNIAMVNELKLIYDAMGIDVWKVIKAASSKPFGFMPFYPGPGLGGHCIPIDPYYLTWRARGFGLRTRFIELAGEVNRNMPRHVVGRLRDELGRTLGKALSRSSVLIVGLAYKKNVDDIRESPSLTLFELLEEAGAQVSYYDPYVPIIPVTREHGHLSNKKSIEWTTTEIARHDVALIATDHDNTDYRLLVDNSKLIVDTRNACERAGIISPRVVKA